MTPPPRHVESNAWLLVKHAAQLGLVAAVACFVVQGDRHPVVTLAVAVLAITGLAVVAMLDRQRYASSGIEAAAPVVVDVVGPGMWSAVAQPAVAQPAVAHVPAAASWHMPRAHAPMVAGVVSVTGLAPLVADMSIALDAPVDVT